MPLACATEGSVTVKDVGSVALWLVYRWDKRVRHRPAFRLRPCGQKQQAESDGGLSPAAKWVVVITDLRSHA